MVSFALDILILRCWQITEVEIAVGHLKAKDPPQKKKKEQNLCKWICFFSGFFEILSMWFRWPLLAFEVDHVANGWPSGL